MRFISKKSRLYQQGLVALVILGLASGAQAATTSGTMAVTGTLAGSISIALVQPPGNIGTVTRYDHLIGGWDYSSDASTWSLSTIFPVTVHSYNTTSASYTITASLASAPPAGIVLSINATTLGTTAATLTTTGTYESTLQWSFAITIDNSATVGPLSRTVTLVATSN
jgi:hypothetical protein